MLLGERATDVIYQAMAARKRVITRVTPRQQKAVLLLAAGMSDNLVAEQVGARGPDVIKKWMRSPGFKNELASAREYIRDQFESRMLQLAGRAQVVVKEMMESKDMSTKAKGAQITLQATVKLVTRYKEFQHEGVVQSSPVLVMPAGTQLYAGSPPSWVSNPSQVLEIPAKVVSDRVADGDDDSNGE